MEWRGTRTKKMRPPSTPQDIAELSKLWEEYQRAMVFALEIIRTDGTNAATFPKVRAQHEKACRTIELIRTFYGVPTVRR
jgi:hypothetical protein